MSTPEFSRRIPLDRIGDGALAESIAADVAERAALCARFGWLSLDRLEADGQLTTRADGVAATGRLRATLAQPCAVTGDPVPAHIDTSFEIRFVDGDTPAAGEGEFELAPGDLDVMAIEDGAVDLGEAAAQTLALALDPYPRSAAADGVMSAMGAEEAGPFAGLKDLLKRG
jgi:uncharacterized metal-binding protein YceD (DUF177 family)